MPPKEPPKDRDVRETIQPPASVRSQIAGGRVVREDATPVGPIPLPKSEIDPSRAINSRATVGDLDKLQSDISNGLKRVDDWVKKDAEEHASIRESQDQFQSEIREEVGIVRSQNDQQNSTLLKLSVESRETAVIVKQLAAKAKADAKRAERMRTLSDQDEYNARRQRRSFWWYFARACVGVAVSAATLAIEHLFK
jgi:hypothetical protein